MTSIMKCLPNFLRDVWVNTSNIVAATGQMKSQTSIKLNQSMLDLTCERAELKDGQTILELGCGWGAISLWMAEHYPNSKILSVSIQTTKKIYRKDRCSAGLQNLQVQTCDMNSFETDQTFDRVVSVEMFEHMKNYDELLRRINKWLNSEGKLFVHIFSHNKFAYHFETEGEANWMGRHFFTGALCRVTIY